MGRIELYERVWGGGLVGHVDSAPSLSWIDSQALQATAHSAAATASLAATAVSSLTRLGYEVEVVARAVYSLEARIGLTLERQTAVMAEQSAALDRIDVSLRNPAKVRAAERVSDAGKLLARGRFDRSLSLALEATEDDPAGPAGYLAAAWALFGLKRLEEARGMFAEAALFADGDASSEASRQQARIAFALDDRPGALASLEPLRSLDLSPEERAAVGYDLGVYGLVLNEPQALADIRAAFEEDSDYCLTALADPALNGNMAVCSLAEARIAELDAELDERRHGLLAELASVHGAVAEATGDATGRSTLTDLSATLEALGMALSDASGSPKEQLAILETAPEQLEAARAALASEAASRDAARRALQANLEELQELRTRHLTSNLPRDDAYRMTSKELGERIDDVTATLARLDSP